MAREREREKKPEKENKERKKKKCRGAYLNGGENVGQGAKIMFSKMRPGCWENRSSPLQACPKVNWGITGGERKPLTRPPPQQ